MAHIQKRTRADKRGRIVRDYYVRWVQGGKERSKRFPRRADAEAFLSDHDSKKRRGEWVDPALGRLSLEDWAGRWLATVRPTLKPKTVDGYESLLRSRILPALGGYPTADLRPSDVQEWVNGMRAAGLSVSRIRQAHVVLSQALEDAVRDGRIARNVARGARLPRLERREAPYVTPELVEQVASAMREPYDLLVRTLGTLGLRFGEAAALRRRSVDLLGRRLVVSESLAEVGGRHIFGATKTHATRRVPLPPSLAEDLEEHLSSRVAEDPEALVFTSPGGGPLRHSTFRSRYWLPALERAGVPIVGLHVLRHSAAAALISSGASAKAVQAILGHRSAAFTLTVYGHLFDEDLDAVAASLDARIHRGTDSETGKGRGTDGAVVVRLPREGT